MTFETLLHRAGVPTLYWNFEVTIDSTKKEQAIALKMPEGVGRIYGLDVPVGGTMYNAAGINLIDIADATDLWVDFKKGSTVVIHPMRLDNLVFSHQNSDVNPNRYLPVNIPGDISIDQSILYNPSAGYNAKVVLLNFRYISISALKFLVDKGHINEMLY